MVQGCTRTKQTFWTEDQFTVTASSGIRDRDARVAKIVARELEKAKPDKWGCVQARELWSPTEERQVRPGHFWLLQFGKVPGSNSCVRSSSLVPASTLVVDVCLYRVDEDASVLTFEEWDPSADTDASEAPVVMIVKSSERTVRAARPLSRFTGWVPGGMYSPWITTTSSGHDVSGYELGASGLPRAYVSPQQPWKN
jgi:hypothetical protein